MGIPTEPEKWVQEWFGEIPMSLYIIKQAERESIKVDNLRMDTEIAFVSCKQPRAELEELLE